VLPTLNGACATEHFDVRDAPLTREGEIYTAHSPIVCPTSRKGDWQDQWHWLRVGFSAQGVEIGSLDADDLTADELEQLAQSLAVDGSLRRADTLRVVDVLRAVAKVRRDDWPSMLAEPLSRWPSIDHLA
jgi:hypothetical protein